MPIWITKSLLWYSLVHGNVGLATTFTSVDNSNPNPELACFHRDLDDEKDLVVAHKTLPCKSKVFIYNIRTKRSVIARVGDRGPKNAAIDLSQRTAKAIRSNGWDQVFFMPVR